MMRKCVVRLAALLLAAVLVFSCGVTAFAAGEEQCQDIKVMSFNVYTMPIGKEGMRKRLNGVTQTILSEMPDSVGLQEAHGLWRCALARELEAYYAIACNQGRFFGFGEGTPIFYRKDKYELLEEGVFWLSERPDCFSWGWDAAYPRVAGYAVLEHKETGFVYVHFNTHFDVAGATARRNSAALIAARMQAMELPAVLTGDLNEKPGGEALDVLAAGGLKDLREIALRTDTDPTYHGYRDSGSVLDYIFANGQLEAAAELKVLREKYDGLYPSDHFAVAAALTLRQ